MADGSDQPLGIGRRSRSVPGWLQRCLRHRDQSCRFPGCERTRGVQAHHVVHWADGGPTDVDNLVSLCRRHHHVVHEQGWTITTSPERPGRFSFCRPDGSPFAATGPPGLRDEVRQRLFGDDDGQTSAPPQPHLRR